ncbi:hypothetical protein L204_102387 [Cryptococcus depauperatus]
MAANRFISTARVARPLVVSRTATQARGYASATFAGGSNWPMIFSVAGVAGLGTYAYLKFNPSVKEELVAKSHELEQKAAGKIKSGEAQKDAAERTATSVSALVKDSFVPLTLAKVDKHNHNTNIYHFTFGEDGQNKTSGVQVASIVLMRSPQGEGELLDDKGKPIIRPYTPISAPDQKGFIKFMIKEYPTGKFTPWLANLKPGQQVLFKGPLSKFKYEANSFDKGLCIAGGSGITPMWQLITHSLSLPEDKTKWTLIFSNVTESDILLRKEWDQLAKQYPNRLQVKYVLDKGPWGWKGDTGFVTPELISKHFPKTSGEKVRAFVCGPIGQMKAVSGLKDGMKQGELAGALKELGYTSEEVFKY